jgi:hypothetical protein
MYSPEHCKIGQWTVSLTPPLNQVMSGAVLGFVRAAKNQNLAVKHRLKKTEKTPEFEYKPDALIRIHVTIS